MKISEVALIRDNFELKQASSNSTTAARHSNRDDIDVSKTKVIRADLLPRSSDLEASATESSSSGSSPSDLKKRLQQLPPINEFTLLVDRVTTLSRRISHNIDFVSLQERSERIEENVEKEEKEEEEQKRQDEDKFSVPVETSPKVDAKSARARRRARIRLESLRAENLAMVISQPEEIASAQVTDESKDEKKSERKSCRSIIDENSPNNEVPQFSAIELTDLTEITSYRSTHSKSSRPTFAENLPDSENSTRSEQVEASRTDYPLYSVKIDSQEDSMKIVDNHRSPFAQFSSSNVRPTVCGGYRPRSGVALKNLSSESDSETTTETVRNPFPSTCRITSPVVTLEMMSPMSTPNSADGPRVLPVLTARRDRISESGQLYSPIRCVTERDSSARLFRQTSGSQRSMESTEDRVKSINSYKNTISNAERTPEEGSQKDIQVNCVNTLVNVTKTRNITPLFNGGNTFGGDFLSKWDNTLPGVTTRSEPPSNDKKFTGRMKNTPHSQIRSSSTRHASAKRYSKENNTRRRLFPSKPLNHDIKNDRIGSTNIGSEQISQEKLISDFEYNYQNDLNNTKSSPTNHIPETISDNKTTECLVPSFADNTCFSSCGAVSVPTGMFHGGQNFTDHTSTLSTGGRAHFSVGSVANNTDYHESTDVTDVPTLTINSQEISYPVSTGSRELSNERPLDPNALIRALSNISARHEGREKTDDNYWKSNDSSINDSSATRFLKIDYGNDGNCEKSIVSKSRVPIVLVDRSKMQNVREQSDEMSSAENFNSMSQSPIVPPIPEISGLISEEPSCTTSRRTEDNFRMGYLMNESIDPPASQLKSLRSKTSRHNLSSTERSDMTYRIENVTELLSDTSTAVDTLPSNSITQCNYHRYRNERLPSWISAHNFEEYSSSDKGKVKRINLGTQTYQVNKLAIVKDGKPEHPSSESEEDINSNKTRYWRDENEEIRRAQSDVEIKEENESPKTFEKHVDDIYQSRTQSSSDEETHESHQSSKLAEKISTILNQSMKRSNFKQLRSPESTKVRSETMTFYCQRLHEIAAVSTKISASTPKLNYSHDTKISPKLRKKSQDRFPFTISESTSVKSMKFEVMPASGKPNHPEDEPKSPETSYKLEHHPSIMRLACSGFEDTPAEVLSCVSQARIESKYHLMPIMKGFVKRFLRRNRKHNSDKDLGSTKIIYKNRKCYEGCSVESRSDEKIDEDGDEEVERLSSIGNPLENEFRQCELNTGRWTADSRNAYSSAISSGKALKQKISLEHISVRSESPLRRFDRDDLWVKELQAPEVRTHRSPEKSTERTNTDRYSIFLARSGNKTADKSERSFTQESCKKDESRRKKDKSRSRKNIDEDFYRDTGCLCFRFCRLLTSTSAIPTLGYRQSIKRNNSYSRRRRKVRGAFHDRTKRVDACPC